MIKNANILIPPLLLKLFAIVFFTQVIAYNDYIPFLESTLNYGINFNPWYSWLADGGSVSAFPYGYAMWIVFYPLFLIFYIFDLSSNFAYFTILLVADFGILYFLISLNNKKQKEIILIYWLSPIIFLSTYVIGLNDIIPVF